MARSILELLRQEREPLAQQVVALVDAVHQHPVFTSLRSVQHVRTLMEHHVWCVWDFMCLLKSIQATVAPACVPWLPTADTEAARLVNEIVTGEETDEGPEGIHVSHFELYLQAMRAAGADTAPLERFLSSLQAGASWQAALEQSSAPKACEAFVKTTLELCQATLAERVAAFTLGREELIPGMFRRLVSEHAQGSRPVEGRAADLRLFLWYLERHIDVDGGQHGPMSARLFQRTCLVGPDTRAASLGAAARVLTRRLALWDAVQEAVG